MELKYFELALKSLGGFVALVGVFIAVLKYLQQKAKDNRTAAIEARKPFSTKQQDVYFSLVKSTAIISTSDDKAEVEKADAEFWALFWGAIPMVADEEVAKAVDAFADTYDHPEDKIAMRNASMSLARACRRSLGVSWNVDLRPNEISRHAKLSPISS